MSLAFLAPASAPGAPPPSSPLAGLAPPEADASLLPKLELSGDLASLGLRMGTAVRLQDAWWCPVTPVRALVLGPVTPPDGVRSLDVTSQYAALRVTGPQARETIARFCSLDLRDEHAPVGAFRPGSVARTPGFVLRESADSFLLLAGAAYADYLWRVVSHA